MRAIASVFAIVFALLPAGAVAQHPHQGGQAQIIGPYEVELVAKRTEVTLFVLDKREQNVDAAPLSGSAEVLAKGNERKTITFKPAGDNKLSASIDFPIEGKFRATVTLKNAQGEVGKGRYAVDVIR
jgi:hypothetical protein